MSNIPLISKNLGVRAFAIFALTVFGLTGCKPGAPKAPAAVDPLDYSISLGADNITYKLEEVVVARKDETIELRPRVRIRNDTKEKFTPDQARDFKLINGSNNEVPPFFQALDPKHFVVPKDSEPFVLRYRVNLSDLAGPLYLEFRGTKRVVKDRKPLVEDRLPLSTSMGGQKSFVAVDWTAAASVGRLPPEGPVILTDEPAPTPVTPAPKPANEPGTP